MITTRVSISQKRTSSAHRGSAQLQCSSCRGKGETRTVFLLWKTFRFSQQVVKGKHPSFANENLGWYLDGRNDVYLAVAGVRFWKVSLLYQLGEKIGGFKVSHSAFCVYFREGELAFGSAEHCDDRNLCLSGRSGIIIQLHKHLVFGLPIKKGP